MLVVDNKTLKVCEVQGNLSCIWCQRMVLEDVMVAAPVKRCSGQEHDRLQQSPAAQKTPTSMGNGQGMAKERSCLELAIFGGS